MVPSELQSRVAALSADERVELIAYIEGTLEAGAGDLTAEQQRLVSSRDADLDADSSRGESIADHRAWLRTLLA